jgi:hypothetical protein
MEKVLLKKVIKGGVAHVVDAMFNECLSCPNLRECLTATYIQNCLVSTLECEDYESNADDGKPF